MLKLTNEEKSELLELLKEKEVRVRRRLIDTYFPASGPRNRTLYPKHMMFFEAGVQHKLRLFMAANRVGKSLAAIYEVSLHLTGQYPKWWKGRKFDKPTDWWLAGVDSNLVKATLQPFLLGQVGDFGTGMLPYDCLDFDTLKDAKKADTSVGMFRVKHVSGNYSTVEFKSYESGREAFQGTAKNILLDEEPPLPIFTECLYRTAGDFCLMMTFTPLKGISNTILNFLEGQTFHEGSIGTGKHVTMASWDDVPHLTEEDKSILIAATPPWLRDARTRGIPSMGSGAIYPMQLHEITVKRFEIPKHWKRYCGLDVGGKTAAIWFAIDPGTQIHYGYHEYYREGELPSVHAQGIAPLGQWIPIAIDHAAHGRSQIDGENLFDLYKDLGLVLSNANKAVETGLYTCWERLSTGKVKIFDDLKRFVQEYQLYRKDEKGKVVKVDDHIMDAFRYAQMSSDLAINESEAKKPKFTQFGHVSPQYKSQPLITRR